ncbi:MAG: glycosyltransferase [Flavobacteriaceae bacterium]|nr:glycosyltransferase [Flavobacteriaceae bacterium]
MNKRLLLIFTRNPELGKCKTRLAKTIGDQAALDIYKFLLNHTVEITKNFKVDKWVYYSEEIWDRDVWSNQVYVKKLQDGKELGERMFNAFKEGFEQGYSEIIVIGSDLFDISQTDLELAFQKFTQHDFVIGPALDGGYYLLGMRKMKEAIFQNKKWGTSSVLENTLTNLEQESVAMLDTRNDVDYYEDIKDIKAFDPFLKDFKLNN